VVSLINSLVGTERLDVSRTLLNQLDSTAAKSVHLRRLQEQSHKIGHLRSTGQLLGLAFANEPHLNLAPFASSSTLAISAALETALVPPTSVSLSIDTLLDPPSLIIDAISAHPTIKALYLLQQPTRGSDDPSRAFFLALASHPTNPRAHLTKLHISGAYSTPLRNEPFLPLSLCHPPPVTTCTDVYPVHNLFIRHHPAHAHPSNPPKDHHYYLGDALLRPERFAAGFLVYLRSLLTSAHATHAPDTRPQALFCFACAPPDLSADKGRVEIGPIPVVQPPAPPAQVEAGDELGCGPGVKNLVHGSWSVLVERRVWIDVGNKGEEARGMGRENARWMPDLQAACVRYAFVRVVKDGGLRAGEEDAGSARNGGGGGVRLEKGRWRLFGWRGFWRGQCRGLTWKWYAVGWRSL
jgi:hypothetical protein